MSTKRKLTEQELKQLVREEARRLLEQEKEKARIYKELKKLRISEASPDLKNRQQIQQLAQQILPELEQAAQNITPETVPSIVQIVAKIPYPVMMKMGSYWQQAQYFSHTVQDEQKKNPNNVAQLVKTIVTGQFIPALKTLASGGNVQ